MNSLWLISQRHLSEAKLLLSVKGKLSCKSRKRRKCLKTNRNNVKIMYLARHSKNCAPKNSRMLIIMKILQAAHPLGMKELKRLKSTQTKKESPSKILKNSQEVLLTNQYLLVWLLKARITPIRSPRKLVNSSIHLTAQTGKTPRKFLSQQTSLKKFTLISCKRRSMKIQYMLQMILAPI